MSESRTHDLPFRFEKSIKAIGVGKIHPNDFATCQIIVHQLPDTRTVKEVVPYELDKEVVVVIGQATTRLGCIIDLCLQTMKMGEVCVISTA